MSAEKFAITTRLPPSFLVCLRLDNDSPSLNVPMPGIGSAPGAQPPSLGSAAPLETRSDWIEGARHGVLLGLAVTVLLLRPVLPTSMASRDGASTAVASNPPRPVRRDADFKAEEPSMAARRLADWVVSSGDNQHQFFVLLDKKNTRVFVFNADGTLRGATPVLIGAARGDDSVAGIGNRPIALVAPHERTTPAGRFVGERGRNVSSEDVVWVDYAAAVSMHRVRANEPAERRLERLASPSTEDNRISYGCINVPVAFYEAVLKPAFDGGRGTVYVLPEVKALDAVFTSVTPAAGTRIAPGAPGRSDRAPNLQNAAQRGDI